MPSRVRRVRPLSPRLCMESLERRLALTGNIGGEPDPAIVSPPSVASPSAVSARPEPFSTGLTAAAEDRPWIQMASAAETGSVVLWVRVAVASGVPSVQTLPVWGRLNGAASVDVGIAETLTHAPPGDFVAAGVTGWWFDGSGTDPATASPQPLETFMDAAVPGVDGLHDVFIVLQSPSDLALSLTTLGAVLAGAPGASFVAQPETVADPSSPVAPATFGGLLRSGRSAPSSGILPDDADAAAWLRDARGSETGSFVIWADTTAGMPTILPLFVKFNPSAADDPAFNPSVPRRRGARLYPADGGASEPLPDFFSEGIVGDAGASAPPAVALSGDSGSPPAPAMGDASAISPPADGPLPRSGFVVVHTDSNFEILMSTMFIPLMTALARGMDDTDTALNGTTWQEGDDSDVMFAAFGSTMSLPVLPAPTVALVNDTGVNTDGITSDGRLAVGAAEGAEIVYSTDDGRTWVSEFVAIEGLNRVAVRQVNALGRLSPDTTFQFTLDTRSPAAPRITLADGTSPAAGNPLRRQAELAMRGLEPSARVEYSVDGGPWVGSWRAVEGQNAVRVRQVDVAGNASQPSVEMRFRLDSQVEQLTVRLARDTGRSGVDRVTSDPTLVLGRREAGAAVQYSINGGATWSRRFVPREGRNVLLVRQIDHAGNVSPATRFSFTLDRVRPPVPVVVPVRGRGGVFVVDGRPAGTRLEYSVGGGTWTTDAPAAAGQRRSMRVRFVDRAGNASAASAPIRGTVLPG